MKSNQKILFAIGLGVIILLNIVIFGWLLADFFSGSNGSEETVSTTDSEEKITGGETTEPGEPTQEETLPWELIVGEVPLQDAKRVIHTFSWGKGEGQLGYCADGIRVVNPYYPKSFAVEGGSLYVLDEANGRILIYENNQYSEINISSLSQGMDIRYHNGWIGVLGKDEDGYVMMLRQKNGGVEMNVKVPDTVENDGAPSEILEIGDTYVIWKVVSKAYDKAQTVYRYDWTDGSLEQLDVTDYDLSETKYNSGVFGNNGEDVYYCYVEEGNNIKVINRENGEYRIYTKVDNESGYYMVSQTAEYLSIDGCLYLMEFFIDRVEISELKLEMESADILEGTQTDEPTAENSAQDMTQEEITSTEDISKVELIYAEVPLDNAKTVVHTFSWGEGDGQLGFYGNISADWTYTRAFAIEDGVIYLLDEVNHRVLIYEENRDFSFDISEVLQPSGMVYGDGRIAVYDENREVTVIYQKDGSVETSVEMVELFRTPEAYVKRLLAVGDTYVEWAVRKAGRDENYMLYETHVLHYDWAEDTWELRGAFGDKVYSDPYCIHLNKTIKEANSYMIYRETESYRLYVNTYDSKYPDMDGEMIYLSADGHLYLLECLETHAQISELKLEEEIAILPKEPPSYEVLDEFFAEREGVWTVAEKPENNAELWQFIQDMKKMMGGMTIMEADVKYTVEEVISETESEVKLRVYENLKYTYVFDGSDTVRTSGESFSHIIRLSKHEGTYQVKVDSYYNKMRNFKCGLEEDLELLKWQTGGVAG